MKKFLLSFIFLSLATLSGQTLDEFIENALEEWEVPGASVAVVRDNQVILLKGYGVAKIGTNEKVDQDTIFQLASITKAFTAAALGVQVDQKKLSWDDEVIRHLPQFALKDPYPTRYATARDLLAHRTGLPAFGGDLMGKLGYSKEDLLYRVRFVEPATSFRDKPHYSNLGYFVAGELLAAVSGQSWKKTVQQTILSPLNMSRSGFESNLKNKNVAYGHIKDGGRLMAIPWDVTGGFPAAGAITSTAADMSKWMMMLLDGGKGILKPETIQEMFVSSMSATPEFSEAPPIDENSGFNFGMGWDNYHYEGHLIVEKGGGLDGIRTVTTLIPELNLGITVLCNRNLTLFPEAVRAYFLTEFIGSDNSNLQEEIKKSQEALNHLLVPEKPPKNPLPPLNLRSYEGDYSSPLYEPFRVILEQGELVVYAGPDQYKGKLRHWSGNTFDLSWPAVNSGYQQVTFVIGPEGRATEIQTETLGTLKKSSA